MAKFKCKLSGNFVSFEHAHDIESMRKHPDYEEVTERIVLPTYEESLQAAPVAAKKAGRPAKAKE
jgi:hypothetical protein